MIDDDAPDDPADDDGSAPTDQPTTSASNTTTARKQRVKAVKDWEQAREFWSRTLRDPTGGTILWNMLRDLHVFEDEQFACGPNGFPAPGATEHARGQRDFGMRLYRTLIRFDREAVFALHDQHDPFFAPPRTARKTPRPE